MNKSYDAIQKICMKNKFKSVLTAVLAAVTAAGFAACLSGCSSPTPSTTVQIETSSSGSSSASNDSSQNSVQSSSSKSSSASTGGIKQTVDAYTWEELSQISKEIANAADEDGAIEVAKKYNLCNSIGKLDGGQSKSVTLADGTKTSVQIVGFAHDDKTEGGKAGITFIFSDCIEKKNMNLTETNDGGWEKSWLRDYLATDGMAMLPKDLQQVIVPVDKLTNNVGETQGVSSVSTTSDSLWLFSLMELYGPKPENSYGWKDWQIAIINAEGTRYQLFENVGVSWDAINDILKKEWGRASVNWWTRTPDPTRSNFEAISTAGQNTYPLHDANGVVPGFCI